MKFHSQTARQIARGVFVLAGMLPLVVESHARDIGALGGGGGVEFRSNCHPDDVIVGFDIRIGKALDAVSATCVRLNPQRTAYAGKTYKLGFFGGGGGASTSVDCNSGYAVRHLHVYMDANKIVNHFRITCQALNSGDWHDAVPLQLENTKGVSIGDVRFSCGEGEWATGIYGRYGALVDQLGLQCDKLVTETPPSTAEPPILGGAAPGRKVITKIPGDVTAEPTPTPPPPPPPPPATCTIKKPSDIYDAPGGVGAKIGFLAANTPGVTLLARQGTDWFHLKWPAGQGWGFSGPGYPDAIACP